MAEELRRVRKAFIDKSSSELISELIDGLVQDRILNLRQKDSILEEFKVTAHRAANVIDTVSKKGDAASRKMIAHLEKSDPTLFSELGLSSRPCPAPAPLLNQTCGGGAGAENYPVTEESKGNRVALIITNIQFRDQGQNRKGAEKDREKMESLFKWLNYEVISHTDLTGQQMKDAVIEFSKHPKLKFTDSVFVIIMSHGKQGNVLGIEGEQDEFPLDFIYERLSTEKCPALLDKPKILIIQACRGGHPGRVFVEDGAAESNGGALRAAHKEKDFSSLYSSTPETFSYRDIVEGSLLIQHLLDVFKRSAEQDDISELFRKVMHRFEEKFGQDKFQMPCIERCSLTRKFYFSPR